MRRLSLALVACVLASSSLLLSQQLIDRQKAMDEVQKALDAIKALPEVVTPPALKETCNADGTPNGVDEDQDGAVDEICKALPPVDCQVSAFALQTAGSWSSCVGGVQTRTETWARTVTTPPANGGAACPALTEIRTGTQACTPPQPTGGIPTGWDDPRFANLTARGVNSYNTTGTVTNFQVTTTSGDPMLGCRNFTAKFFRLSGREGVRVCGGDVLLEDFYIRATGTSSSDHADGIQHYIGSPGSTLKDRNGNAGYQLIARRGIVEINGTCTAGLFSADGSRGRIWLEDVKFISNNNCKGLRVNVDGGGPVSCVRCVFQNAPQIDVAVDVWEGNTMLNGTPVPRPSGK